MSNVSGAGGYHWNRHRNVKIQKVENGYSVTARFFDSEKDEKWECAIDREFVFEHSRDVTDFVDYYLKADGRVLDHEWTPG